MLSCLTSSYEPSSYSFSTASVDGPAGIAGADTAAGAGAAAFVPPATAASTSRLTTRPCGPLPEMAVISTPSALAIRRASGDANTLSPPLVGTGPAFTSSGTAGTCAALTGAAGLASSFTGAASDFGSSFAGAGAAAPPAAAAALASSPSSARIAISALTFTPSVPSGTTILATVPSSTASTSIVALSVSISAITSPGDIVSPSLTSHLARLPSSIVGESAGMVMLIGMVLSLIRCR